MSENRKNDAGLVNISPSEQRGLKIAFFFGLSLVILIGLLGSDVFIDSALAREQLPWLVCADVYFRKDITVPLGAVTLVFMAVLLLDRKPKLELSLGTVQAIGSVAIAMVASGIVNLSFVELWVSAIIILSPATVFFATEQISRRCFGL